MSFRLVPKSVTLNDLERRNSSNLCVITPNSVTFGTDYVKPVDDTPAIYHLRRYWQWITPSERVKVRHFPLDLTVTCKQYKIVGKLVLITNGKSYMTFRLV